MTLREQMRKRIEAAPSGEAFTTGDFLDLAPYESVRKVLPWMAKDGEIRRIIQGIYDRPYFSEFLQEHRAPDIQQVALALARSYNWTIAPSGATAANLLGLSTQVPAHWQYISDGPYRSYDIQGMPLSFLHRNNRSITSLSPKTILVIEALKHLGEVRQNEDDEQYQRIIKQLKAVLTRAEVRIALEETKKSSQWIHNIMREDTANHED